MTEDDARDWIRSDWGMPALERLQKLVDLLREENQQQNLVSPTSLNDVWVRHIADSVQHLRFVEVSDGDTWLDIGSGAGFPGAVVALLCPKLRVILAEPRRKRCEWLNSVTEALGMQNCEVCCGRIEQVGRFPAAMISARAVASLGALVAWGAPFSTNATTWLLPKGRSGAQELDGAGARLRKMFHVEQSLTDKDAVILVGRGVPGSSR